MSNGGTHIAEVLVEFGVQHLFTLCGGHISPILVEAKRRGIKIVDVRDEASAVFAADAVARMTGIPGVAAVTAGPGVTNTLTAVQNAKMAESPVLIFGGATATVLRGRGSLQDIDQLTPIKSLVKEAARVTKVKDLAPTVRRLLKVAQEGTKGPVFLEVPVDLLYPEEVVREWYLKEGGGGKSLSGKAQTLYLKQHLWRQFKGKDNDKIADPPSVDPMEPSAGDVRRAAALLSDAKHPVLVVGSQVVAIPQDADAIAAAIRELQIPAFMGGSARGLLGKGDPIQLRHKRTQALREADAVIVAGFPLDFRMGYGRKINRDAKLVTINRDPSWLRRNRRPDLAVHADPGRFLQALANELQPGPWSAWLEQLRAVDDERCNEIIEQSKDNSNGGVNPLHVGLEIEERLADDSIIVVDGGDFVASCSYVISPRSPLSWLDPGVYGTLGVGGGFTLGAASVRPGAEVWLLWGDGAAGFSIAEVDTMVRHGMKVIMVVGNDASWGQIARDQITTLGDDVGTVLLPTNYQTVCVGYGGQGLLVKESAELGPALDKAREMANDGPVLVNVLLGKSDFRKGSISL